MHSQEIIKITNLFAEPQYGEFGYNEVSVVMIKARKNVDIEIIL